MLRNDEYIILDKYLFVGLNSGNAFLNVATTPSSATYGRAYGAGSGSTVAALFSGVLPMSQVVGSAVMPVATLWIPKLGGALTHNGTCIICNDQYISRVR